MKIIRLYGVLIMTVVKTISHCDPLLVGDYLTILRKDIQEGR